jgi:hypothetical protein
MNWLRLRLGVRMTDLKPFMNSRNPESRTDVFRLSGFPHIKERTMKETDRQHFDSYRQKQQTVIDRVTGIINRRHNGLYVWGETGVGKTWNIEETLTAAQRDGLRPFNKLAGKCSPLGLFELARDHQDAILFIDDDPTLVQDQLSQQILLHLCGDGHINPENGRNERRVTNIKSKSRETCVFTGSVIISNNVRLANMPVLRALQGRIRTYNFRPTTSELVAMLRHLAETIEHPDVDAEERKEICEFIIAEAENSQQQIDLRLLKHAISDYVQWKSGEVKLHWKQLVVSSMRDYFAPVQVLCREERKIHEQDHILVLIEEMSETGGSRKAVVAEWMRANEKEKTAFYDRLKELPEEWQRRFRALPDKRASGTAEFVLNEVHGLDLQKLIEKYELIPGMAQSDVVSAWCKMVERPAAELPRLLRTLGADWENRFAAFPVERLARPVRQDNGQDHKKPEEPKPEEPLTYGAVLSAILKRNPKYIGRGMLGEPKYQRHWMPTTRFLQLVPADHHELLEHPMAIHDGVGIAHVVHIEEMGRTQVILRQGWNSDILPETLGLGSDGFVVYPDDDKSYLRLSVRDFEMINNRAVFIDRTNNGVRPGSTR